MPTMSRIPPKGIYVPQLAFFNEGESVDHATIAKHAAWLSDSGIHGLVCHGTTGEPAHLLRSERKAILETTVKAVRGSTKSDLPIVVGIGSNNLRETLELAEEASEAGADFALVVAPSFFAKAMTNEVLYEHFCTIADKSKLPVILYNFPGIAQGIDLDEALILRLAQHPNIVGIKLSCGNVAKGARLSSRLDPSEFAVFGGLADTLLHGLAASRSSGVVSGLGNISPESLLKVYDLFEKGDLKGAKEAQAALSAAGSIELLGGVPGMRYGVVHYRGYGGVSRKPLPNPSQQLKDNVVEWMSTVMGK